MPRFRRDNADYLGFALNQSHGLGVTSRYNMDSLAELLACQYGQLGSCYDTLPMMQNFRNSHNDLLMGQRIRGDQWNDLQGGLLRNWMGYSPYGGFL